MALVDSKIHLDGLYGKIPMTKIDFTKLVIPAEKTVGVGGGAYQTELIQTSGVTSVKDTNPKDAVGIKKVPFSTIPYPPITEVMDRLEDYHQYPFPYQVLSQLGVAMLEGARKYGRHNYRVAGVRASVYFDAFMRHVAFGFLTGEDIDVESGLSHITKAIATLVVFQDAVANDKWVDDRPPLTHLSLDIDTLDVNLLDLNIRELVETALNIMTVWWENGDNKLLVEATAFLFAAQDKIMDIDDQSLLWRTNLQTKVDEIFQRHPVAKEAFTK